MILTEKYLIFIYRFSRYSYSLPVYFLGHAELYALKFVEVEAFENSIFVMFKNLGIFL